MSRYIVGLTGGIGSGKSSIANLFAAEGIEVVDADQVARDVVAPGTPALAQIIDYFGAEFILANGELDRRALRERVFTQAQDKAWLNALLHPLIREEMFTQCRQAQSPYVVLMVPLLIENGLHQLVDRILVVDVPEDIQRQRAMARDNATDRQIDAIMQAQLSRQARLQQADDIIDNSQPLTEVSQQVIELHRQYCHYAEQKTCKSC